MAKDHIHVLIDGNGLEHLHYLWVGFPQDTLSVYLDDHITYEEEREVKLAWENLLNLDIPSLCSLKSTYILLLDGFFLFSFPPELRSHIFLLAVPSTSSLLFYPQSTIQPDFIPVSLSLASADLSNYN